jgi:hypothetical protein
MDDNSDVTRADTSDIQGDPTPCIGSSSRYTYRPGGSNFPYQWSWIVSGDASILNYWTIGDGYVCDVQLGKQTVTLTFQQSNPPGVPPVQNIAKYISPRKCEES